MNTYTKKTTKICPNNGTKDHYIVVIKAHRTIMVEDINAAIDAAGDNLYQEDFTGFLTKALNADVTVTGTHQGVEIISSVAAMQRLCRD